MPVSVPVTEKEPQHLSVQCILVYLKPQTFQSFKIRILALSRERSRSCILGWDLLSSLLYSKSTKKNL
jgi:hypothetical protein